MNNVLPIGRARLQDDLQGWHARGWINADGLAEILTDLSTRRTGMRFANIAGMLGAIVLCFAAMTFVAANWDEMVRWQRLAVLFGAMWGCYGTAFAFLRNGQKFFGEAAVLASCGMFGANIMLVAQTYHIEGHPPDAVLIWAGGTLLAAGLLRSAAAGALAFGLFALWSGWEMTLQERWWFSPQGHANAHLPFLLAWTGATMLAAWQRWRLGAHMAGLSMAAWVSTCLILDISGWPYLIAALMVAAAAIWVLTGKNASRLARIPWRTVFVYSGLCAAVAYFAVQVDAENLLEWFAGGVGLAAALALVIAGRRIDSLATTVIGYLMFGGELLYIYAKTFGSLIGTAGFFALAGATLVAIAGFAVWAEKHTNELGVKS